MKRKKKITQKDILEMRNELLNYFETGFIDNLSEDESRAEAKNNFEVIFSFYQDLHPVKVKRRVVIKGFENDDEICQAKYDISSVLYTFDQLYENMNGERPNYKINPYAPIAVKKICQKMHVRLRQNNTKDLDERKVEEAVKRMLTWISNDSFWKKKFNLSYIEKAFDSVYDAARALKEKYQSNPEFLLNNL